jgi:hypothetical protein
LLQLFERQSPDLFPAYFSSEFHREDSSSTVSAQGQEFFLLQAAGICRRVEFSEHVGVPGLAE